jgi:hypothetical protein
VLEKKKPTQAQKVIEQAVSEMSGNAAAAVARPWKKRC